MFMDHVRKGKRQIGLLLMLTGLLHTIVGLIGYMEPLQSIVGDGLWNTIVTDGQLEREIAFWFMMFGFMLMLIGYTADWMMKKRSIAPPPAFGWMLLSVCTLGAVIMPVSGFWLGIPQAIVLLRK